MWIPGLLHGGTAVVMEHLRPQALLYLQSVRNSACTIKTEPYGKGKEE